jgi:glycosyltransferase involved in cell wall biosynthesis
MSESGKKKNSSIFVIPRASTAWSGNEAGWITASGWAAAGQQLWGDALVATTDGVFSPMEATLFPRRTGAKAVMKGNGKIIRRFVPEFFITAYKDYKLKTGKPETWPIEKSDLLDSRNIRMVWERHDLFPGIGRKLADRFNVPLVTSVEAPAVWEAKKWGVVRPIWGPLLERYVEASSLKKSDLVSCVSEEVRAKVIEMGVLPEKVIVSHNRVNSLIFHPHVNGEQVKQTYSLDGKRVIGWTGSFRKFHGLDTVVKAFSKVHDRFNDTILMLIGDGMELENIARLADDLGIRDKVILPGRHPVTKIPEFLINFQIGLVSAQSSEGFHYSPLKLREYLATGIPIISARAGNIPDVFTDRKDLLLYEAGNADDLAGKITELLEDSALRKNLRENAIRLFETEGTWLHELKLVCNKLGIAY